MNTKNLPDTSRSFLGGDAHRLQKPPFQLSQQRRACAGMLTLVLAGSAWGATPTASTWMSLEELMVIEISSAAKKPQRLTDAATAIYVLGQDEIRRSGATNVPELLRSVPGVQVSRIDGSRYAVSIRGFSSRYSGKLLVLQDGRTLYSPLLSGTLWEAQDVMLEDVERIEIIRGPGGSLWGANAMNGVINIITKQAQDTQGTVAQAKAGSLEGGASVRHGGRLGESGHFRLYAKVDEHQDMETETGADAHDAWRQKRAGFRADFTPDARDTITLQGDVYDTKAQSTSLYTSLVPPITAYLPDTSKFSGANVLFRWKRDVDATQDWQFQAYFDRTDGAERAFDARVDTTDLDWQHRFRLTPSQELTWGAGYRLVSDEIRGSFTIGFPKRTAKSQIYSAFLQDEIQLNEAWRLTLGTKLEHNDITGLEPQPSARLLWNASPTDTFWTSLSRAVQTPSRSTLDSQVHYAVGPYPPFATAVKGLYGNPSLDSQEMLSREIGYRGQFGPRLTVDAAAFYNTYDNLISNEPQALAFAPYPLSVERFDNGLKGKTYGFEVSGNWQATPDWRLKASYSRATMSFTNKPGFTGLSTFGRIGSTPMHMAQLQSSHRLSHQIELDAFLNYSDALPSLEVPDFARLDLRLGWRPSSDFELSLTGRNLLQRRHKEYTSSDVVPSLAPRSMLVQARWKF
jgi:iron complex outermembrane recepter protein